MGTAGVPSDRIPHLGKDLGLYLLGQTWPGGHHLCQVLGKLVLSWYSF